ncbi:hypothetical protein FQA39_LY04069 [Lamprigera yunnana]|nr:hypothetical protein FQA39_LY04069 [Lamprigera yunnana]
MDGLCQDLVKSSILPVLKWTSLNLNTEEGVIGTTSTASNVTSAVFAVIALHIALGLFIFKAYSDPETGRSDKKDDKID